MPCFVNGTTRTTSLLIHVCSSNFPFIFFPSSLLHGRSQHFGAMPPTNDLFALPFVRGLRNDALPLTWAHENAQWNGRLCRISLIHNESLNMSQLRAPTCLDRNHGGLVCVCVHETVIFMAAIIAAIASFAHIYPLESRWGCSFVSCMERKPQANSCIMHARESRAFIRPPHEAEQFYVLIVVIPSSRCKFLE
jgi:hypothetical protein